MNANSYLAFLWIQHGLEHHLTYQFFVRIKNLAWLLTQNISPIKDFVAV